MRKKSQDVEVLECSFKPKLNVERNRKIGFGKVASQEAVGN